MMSDNEAATVRDRMAILDFEIETMRQSEGTPFYDEEQLNAWCREWTTLRERLDAHDYKD